LSLQEPFCRLPQTSETSQAVAAVLTLHFHYFYSKFSLDEMFLAIYYKALPSSFQEYGPLRRDAV
jgi:hypothetical protein